MEAILNLDEEDSRQAYLKTRMLESIAAVEPERNNREIIAVTNVNVIFWIIALTVVVLVDATCFPFAPSSSTMIVFALYAFYTGLVPYVIYVFDNPFSHTGGFLPLSLELLCQEFLAEIVAASPEAPGAAKTNGAARRPPRQSVEERTDQKPALTSSYIS